MGIKAFRKVQAEDRAVQQFQNNVDAMFKQFTERDILDGVLLKDLSLLAGQDNQISHKLDRELTGYIIIRKRANSTIWDTQDGNKKKNRTLILQCSVNVTIDLWVF